MTTKLPEQKFIVEPHFRLQEWVAEEKGYFKDEGLDYVFRELIQSTDGAHHDKGDKVGAYQSFERGRAPMSAAPATGPWGWRRRRAKAGFMPTSIRSRPRASSCRPPRRSASLRIWPACRSRSATSPAATTRPSRRWSPICRPRRSICRSPTACCSSAWRLLIGNKAQASALFSGPYYFAEQLGFRKIIDTTFMIATMITGNPDPEDLRKFFRALRRAQRDIDLRPDRYTHYYKNEFPLRYHATMDTRRWGPGERLVFEPYTKEVYEETFRWIADHGIFADSGMGSGRYEEAVISTA